MGIYAPQTAEAKARRARASRGLAVVLAILAAAVVGPQAFASEEPGTPEAIDTYTVAPGETLWMIASGITPAGEDVRDTIADIQELNAMTGTALDAGEQIYVPVAG